MQRVTADMCQRAVDEVLESNAVPDFLTLRKGHVDDLRGILAIGSDCFDYNVPTRREIRHALSKMHGALAVLCKDNAVKAYVLIEANLGRKSLYLNTVAVSPSMRGKGLSGALYIFADKIAVLSGAKSIVCHAAYGNVRAVHLLEQHGYEKTRSLEDYYDDGNAALSFRKSFA